MTEFEKVLKDQFGIGGTNIKCQLEEEKDVVVWMSPDEYIDRVSIVNRMSPEELDKYKKSAERGGLKGILYYPPFSGKNAERLISAMESGKPFQLPWIEYDGDVVRSQEGFHRAMAARYLGIDKIPVWIWGIGAGVPLPPFKTAPISVDKEIRW